MARDWRSRGVVVVVVLGSDGGVVVRWEEDEIRMCRVEGWMRGRVAIVRGGDDMVGGEDGIVC